MPLAALKHLMVGDIRTRDEFQLTDALQMMIEQGCKFRTAVDQRDAIHDVRMIPPCIIGKMFF